MPRINIVYVSAFFTQQCLFCLDKKVGNHNSYFNGLNCFEIVLQRSACASHLVFSSQVAIIPNHSKDVTVCILKNPRNFMVLSKRL